VPFLTDLKPNIVTYKDINGEEDTFFVGGGYAEVLPAEVTILAVSAEKLHDIDLDRAERSKNNALTRLKQGKTLGARAIDLAKLDLTPAEEARLKRERIDIVAEQAAVERSVARVRVARKRDMYPHKH
jgi:F0F1-type ATP synthase epsilon subunit